MKNVVVKFSMRVSGGNLPENYSVVVPVEMAFDGIDPQELANIASRALRIDLQRVLRGKTTEFLDDVAQKGLKLHAREAGSNIKTREDRIKELMGAGMPAKLATLAVDDPTKFEALVGSL